MNHAPSLSLSLEKRTEADLKQVIVLLVDDQQIVYEAIKRILKDQSNMVLHYCENPNEAIAMVEKIKPTVILQDLIMPDCDGLSLVKKYRSNPLIDQIPIIVLSSEENPKVKVEAFRLGANDYIVKLPDPLELIARIQYHSNSYIRLLERNEAYQKLDESQEILKSELAEAAAYVKSLFPPILTEKIKTDWKFIPSTQLGGDAFGYHWLDDRYFAIYLLDVCGHGVGAALLSISVINVLKFQNLPKADFHDPSSVLKALNASFQMENHNNMFFTIWYGVYDSQIGRIIYASAGHPPAILMTGKTPNSVSPFELKTSGIAIGVDSESQYENGSFQIEKINQLFVFSDGIFEVLKEDGSMYNFSEFIDYLKHTYFSHAMGLDQVVQTMQQIQRKPIFADDVSILSIKFVRS